MKSIFPAFCLLATFLLVGISIGSPIDVTIETKQKLESIGAKVDFRIIRLIDDDKRSDVRFEVEWSPKIADKAFKPRLDLILYDRNTPGIMTESRHQVRFDMMQNGKLMADFTIAHEELGRTQLVFRNGQQWVHILLLKAAVDGFPPCRNRDPFSKKEEG